MKVSVSAGMLNQETGSSPFLQWVMRRTGLARRRQIDFERPGPTLNVDAMYSELRNWLQSVGYNCIE